MSEKKAKAPAEAPAEGVEAATETPPDELAQALAQCQAEAADLRNQVLYLRADFENTKKRIEKRYREALEFATEPLLKDLLPVLDNLERALGHAGEGGPGGFGALVEGLQLTTDQFRGVLQCHGIQDIAAHGEKFDPNLHQSMLQVPGTEENRVADVYEKGYLLKGRLLRPAKVAVSKVAAPEGDG